MVIEKEASWPAAVTLAGTDAAGELLAILTALPLGAFPLNSSVPSSAVPPEKTLVGPDWLDSMNTWPSAAGSTVSGAVADWPATVAVKVSVAGLDTCSGRIVKLCCPWPAGTTTDAGTAAAFGLLLVRVTVSPPLGAGVVSWTIPDASLSSLVPLNTLVWLRRTTPPSVNTSMVRLLTCGAAFETVKLRVAEKAVAACVPGPDRPWKLRTCQ